MASTDWGNVARSGLGSAISQLGSSPNGFPSNSSSGAVGGAYNESALMGQPQPSVLSEGMVGLVSGITPAGRINNTVYDGYGQQYAEFNTAPENAVDLAESLVPSGRTSNVGAIIGIVEITYYKMQGFFAAGSVYETWVGVGSPNTSPPSGHTLTNIVVVSTFTH